MTQLFPANSDILEYIIIVEVNISQAVMIELIKSSLESISFPVQLDNFTEISAMNVTTVCSLNSSAYQCQCEDQYFWPCDKCRNYGSCGDFTNNSCGCINALPDDGQFCQPVTELTLCSLNSSAYQCQCEDQYFWPCDKCRNYGSCGGVTNNSCGCISALPDDGQFCQPITELTLCSLNSSAYQCQCEDQYFWPCDKCRNYGSCGDVTNNSCGCIKALPDDGQFCQPITELTPCPTTAPTTAPPTPSEYQVEVEMDTVDITVLNQLKQILNQLSLPYNIHNVTITDINITTVCSLNSSAYQCQCEDQYFWPCDKCRTYGSCDGSTNNSCGCINALPDDGQFCQPITELTRFSACPTTAPTTAPPTPSEYQVEVEMDTVDITVLNQMKQLLNQLYLPYTINDVTITDINITTVCSLNSSAYQCQCEDQYFWPCDKCRNYGSCDGVTNNSCGCISALPDDGQFCQPITELTRFSACPTTAPPTPSEYQVEVEMDTVDITVLNQLKQLLNQLSLPYNINNVTITDINITTVCSLNSSAYQCQCEDQYFWPCDKCRTYGSCDGSTNNSCGCINALPDDGQFCQPITELTRFSACPTTAPTTAPPTPSEYQVEVEMDTVDITVLNQLKQLLNQLSLPYTINNVTITDINITTVCSLNSSAYQCQCEDQYFWPCDKCRNYGSCGGVTNNSCGCINALPDDGQFCQPVTELTLCSLNSSAYQCQCEDQYFWPCDKCRNYGSCDGSTNNSCGCISALPDDGQFCQPVTELTLCSLNSSAYQCQCEDQYFWPCDKCRNYGSCGDFTNNSCGCIKALPDDGQFCQPISELNVTNTTPAPTVTNTTPAPTVTNTTPAPTVTSTTPAPTVTNTTPAPTVHNTTPAPTVNKTTPAPTVHNTTPAPTVNKTTLAPTVNKTTPAPTVNNTTPAPTVNKTTPAPTVNNTTPAPTVNNTTPAPTVNKTTPAPTVNKTTPAPTVNKTTPAPTVNKTTPAPTVNKTTPAPTVNKTTPAPTVNKTTPAPTVTKPVTKDIQMSMKLSETFDFQLTNKTSEKHRIYTDKIKRLIEGSYSKVLGYQNGSANVVGFRPGSVIVDYSINATTDKLDLASANKELVGNLSDAGFNVSSDSFARNGEYTCRTTLDPLPSVASQTIAIPDPNLQVSENKVLRCNETEVSLQCCVQAGYEVKWSTPLCKLTASSGCVTCTYQLNTSNCQAGDITEQVTCSLIKGGYNMTITINATNNNFPCYDTTFGGGNLDDIRNGDCAEGLAGNLTAKCNSSKKWVIIKDNCVPRKINVLSTQNLVPNDIPTFVSSLSIITSENASFVVNSSATILTILDLLKKIASVSQSIYVDKTIMTDFLNTLDIIGSKEAQHTWETINNDTATVGRSSELLKAVEDMGHRLSNDSFSFMTNNSIQLSRINTSSPLLDKFGKNKTIQINIPQINTPTFITVIVLSALDGVLPVRTQNTQNDTNGTRINADVVVVQPNITSISLTYTVKDEKLGNPKCVFWNFTLRNGAGGWDTTGCSLQRLLNQTKNFTCECNHTTSFSMLMSTDVNFTPVQQEALDYITYIGVGISMACLVLCLLIEIIVWKSVTKQETSYMRHVSIVNIAVSLLIADICFIIGAAFVLHNNSNLCTATTFFMHFFYLALFFWMLLSALLLLYRTIVVFNLISRAKMMAIAFSVGYGAPLLIAVVTVASTAGRKGYTQGTNCWLNWTPTKALLAFVIPALTIVAINLLVMVVVLYKSLRRGLNASVQRDEKHSLLVIAKCVGILTPLFGLTWGFGIGTMLPGSHFGIHVVFALLNSVQGFFILVFGSLLDETVRKALAKLPPGTFSSTQTRSTSGGPSSSGGFPFFQRFRQRNMYNVSESGGFMSSSSDNYSAIN
ncbi:uncharacterized protein LOC134332859 [Trichomycterus rosablanca]|uniref:uncharacterized protein LOC134332859 n=1 Tax=Trichomycterus rosablanca TaxID=2290929 RepID=UPI002F358F28